LARTRGDVTELKLPAQAPYVMVAKRAAGALASCAGFSLEEIDELNIAVAQACERAIATVGRLWGNGYLKLAFRLDSGRIEVDVQALPGIMEEDVSRAGREMPRPRAERVRRAEELLATQEERRQLQGQAERMAGVAAANLAAQEAAMADLEGIAVNLIRLFVDDLRYNVDARGAVRMRMVKYLVG